ncbi:hypothetical protein WICPIJ_004011 [Wickerhamomyces pijperi]|uniref:Ras-GAP domain-containing protein n=1 Tax=Wickerhamomyces pijperi TaxID=599730 RepID=A0A9P8Q6E2_WICPI|nr:hypothetical protein WICPIJ_004011 [Wickerhamomyces pijperi]
MKVRTIETFIEVNQGYFEGPLQWSLSDSSSFQTATIRISNDGELTIIGPVSPQGSTSERMNQIQVSGNTERLLVESLQSCSIRVIENTGVLAIETFKGVKVYLGCFDKSTFIQLFSSLLFWQNLKPQGILNKRIIKKFTPKTQQRLSSIPTQQNYNILTAHCKVFGLLPKIKNLEAVSGPDVSIFPHNQDPETLKHEKWFEAKVILKSNGLLELVNDSDGQSIYCIDITRLTRDEIREFHHSIFQSSNYLFIGKIPDLRKECVINNTMSSFASADYIISNQSPKVSKVILQFPSRLHVEDWLIALKSFTISHYVGLDNNNLLRVSRKVHINILEASKVDSRRKVYIEVQLWNIPWFRTAMVKIDEDGCAFFRDEFDLDLPMTTTFFRIVLKSSSNNIDYDLNDTVLGHIDMNYCDLETDGSGNPRVALVDHTGTPLATTIYATVSKSTNYILPPANFSHFEKMLQNLDFKSLVAFIMAKANMPDDRLDLEKTSMILLDIFQCLERQKDWFLTLLDYEMKNVFTDSPSSPEVSPSKPAGNNNKLYNSLFRGNSILTKFIEFYNLRLGREYLEKVIGDFVKKVISHNSATEIDPLRIHEENQDVKGMILEKNYDTLLKYMDDLWFKIYQTSNDLPNEIKQQLSLLRKKIELYTTDNAVMLNCITGFMFLRFFCPVLLNPKLFLLTKDHQTGENKRTLTLISKILLCFANRNEFGAKEPYLMRFNSDFIKKHKVQLIDYLDKITLKKMDFSPSLLKLDSSTERKEFKLPTRDLVRELPMVPFLIDKYLRFDQLLEIVTSDKMEVDKLDEFGDSDGSNHAKINEEQNKSELYKIGSLEFEKLILKDDSRADKDEEDDTSYEFGSDKFIQALLKTDSSDEALSYINSNSSLKDLITESDRLSAKKSRLTAKLVSFETVKDITNMETFTKRILATTVIDPQRNVMRYASNIGGMKDLKLLNVDSTFNSLKLKFSHDGNSNDIIVGSNYNNSIHRLSQIPMDHLKKSPTRKLQRMIRSASLNTISSFSRSSDSTHTSKTLMFTDQAINNGQSKTSTEIEIEMEFDNKVGSQDSHTQIMEEINTDVGKKKVGIRGWLGRGRS